MTTAAQILRDLNAGQSSIRALADRLRQPEKVLLAFLDDLEIDGLVESDTIKDCIHVWRLTQLGRGAMLPKPALAAAV